MRSTFFKKLTTFVLSGACAVVAMGSFVFAQPANIFPDVSPVHPHYVAIKYLKDTGVVSGNATDGTFAPDEPINRAAVLKIILAGSGVSVEEAVTEDPFPDVPVGEWFTPYISKAKDLGIVQGNGTDGTFTPGLHVNKAAFLKMLLVTNGIKQEALDGVSQIADDVPTDAWFAPYINYALQTGIIRVNAENNAEPNALLTRGEVARMMYLLRLVRSGEDNQFLLDQAKAEMAQIEIYMAVNDIAHAKEASEIASDLANQVSKNLPDDTTALSAARLTSAYDLVMDAFLLAAQGNTLEAEIAANAAIEMATAAWEADNTVQPTAAHIKKRAREILLQIGVQEQ